MSTSYTLRDLPLPVKVVATVFLLAVGVGYTSAMVQLHMQKARGGTPMPTVDDVVLSYTGKKRFKEGEEQPRPVSRLESLIMGPIEGDLTGQTMAPAFFGKAPGFSRLVKENPAIVAERHGERELFRWWINAPEAVRKQAYDDDKCVIADAKKIPKQITGDFKNDDGSFKIKSLIEVRCARCHSQGGAKADVPLETYDEIKKHMSVPDFVPAKPGEWVKVQEPMSMEKLTQSTHAHLLSFSMLFSLTGLVFAFSSLPKWMRVIGGPWVVIAVFVDVAFWWLARLSDQWGPVFARGIILTGIAAGAGLFAQIVLTLLLSDMYGWKGKSVLAGLFLLGGVTAGLVFVYKVEPALKAKAHQAALPKGEDGKTDGDRTDPPRNANGKKLSDEMGAIAAAVASAAQGNPVAVKAPVSELERILNWPVGEDGQPLPAADVKFNGQDDGTMIPAFFERDKNYKKVIEDQDVPQAGKDKLKAERQSDLEALRAWVKTTEPGRKSAYDADAFALPAELAMKGNTSTFLKNGKVQVKSLITARCLGCHGPDGKQADYPLDSYEGLLAYMKTPDPPAKGNDNGNANANPAPPPPPAPAPARAILPILAAKDD